MASGKEHDSMINTLAPFVGTLGATFGLINGSFLGSAAVVGFGFWFGGMYLSPDLDTKSNPYYRWGLLRLWWLPYRKLIPHRGISHEPLWGTLTRLGWLLFPVVTYWALERRELFLGDLLGVIWWVIPAVLAVELSAWVHLAQDGMLIKGGNKK